MTILALVRGTRNKARITHCFLNFQIGSWASRVSKNISVKASHRTVREPLDSYGSCYPSRFYSQSPMIEHTRISWLYRTILIIYPCFTDYLMSVSYPLTDKFIQIIEYFVCNILVELWIIINPTSNFRIQLLRKPCQCLSAPLCSQNRSKFCLDACFSLLAYCRTEH